MQTAGIPAMMGSEHYL